MVSVKATVNLYGEQVPGRKADFKSQDPNPDMDSNSGAGELHLAKMEMDRLKQGKKQAENARDRAETELHHARIAVKKLTKKLEEFDGKAKSRRIELEQQSKSSKASSVSFDAELMKELREAKQELNRLKFDMASVIDAKVKAEQVIESSRSKLKSNRDCLEELRKKIDEANEEHVLVELAKMEAEKELKEIEDQRVEEASGFSAAINDAKKKIEELRCEIDRSKEFEERLASATSDVNVLQTEMEFVRAMATDLNHSTHTYPEEEELNVAKRELEAIKGELFRSMISMDAVRSELGDVTRAKEILKVQEEKADEDVQSLNSRLMKAQFKLRSAMAAEEKTGAIVANLSAALQQVNTDLETANKEKESVLDETSSVKLETERVDHGIKSMEERLELAIRELDAVKSSEAMAMKKLKVVAERTMSSRASKSQYGETITISRREYDYLSKKAMAAKEVADKKVEAFQAWIFAIQAREKEIAMRTAMAEKEIREVESMKENEIVKIEENLIAREEIEDEIQNWKKIKHEQQEQQQQQQQRSRKSINGVPVGLRRAKVRRISASAGVRNQSGRPPLGTIKRKKKVMPYLVEFLHGRKNREQNLS